MRKASEKTRELMKKIWAERKASGWVSPRIGKKHSEETKLKLSKLASLKINEKNPGWKGGEAKLSAKHQWIERYFGDAEEVPCMFCGDTRFTKKGLKPKKKHWANLDHKYTRDLQKWTVLCGACHVNYDRIILGAKIGRQKTYGNR